jgi:signal transduction histidine kinase
MVSKQAGITGRRARPRLTALSWLLIVAIICVLMLTWLMRNEIRQRIEEESITALTTDVNNAASQVDSQTANLSSVLVGFRNLFIVSPTVPSQAEFSQVYASLNSDPDTSQLSTVSFISNDSVGAQLRYQQSWLSKGQLSPTNFATVNGLAQTLENAKDSGHLLASPIVSGVKGFDLVLPIYKNGSIPSSQLERQMSLVGFMVETVPYTSLLANNPIALGSRTVDYSVEDVSSSANSLIFHTNQADLPRSGNVALQIRFPVAGRTWQIQAVAAQDYGITPSDQTTNALIAVFDAGLVVLLFMVLYFQIQNRRERLLEQSKDEFVSLVSHQLRAPLTSIQLFVEMLLDQRLNALSAKQREYLKNVQISTGRMTELVTEFLNVSKLELGQLEVTTKKLHLEDIVNSVVTQLSPLAEKHDIKLSYKKPELPPVAVEPNLYGQIVNNLLSNAINYSPEGNVVELSLHKNQNGYQLDVVDHGIGIPSVAKAKLFARFYRADNAKRVTSDGSGLGLYLVKKVLDTCGGSVWYESTEGQGSSFHVIIPLSGMRSTNKNIGSK